MPDCNSHSEKKQLCNCTVHSLPSCGLQWFLNISVTLHDGSVIKKTKYHNICCIFQTLFAQSKRQAVTVIIINLHNVCLLSFYVNV